MFAMKFSMEKQIIFFWIAGFFLPAINATVFSHSVKNVHISQFQNSHQTKFILHISVRQSQIISGFQVSKEKIQNKLDLFSFWKIEYPYYHITGASIAS